MKQSSRQSIFRPIGKSCGCRKADSRRIDNVAVECGEGGRLHKRELRAFLMKLDDLQSVFRQAERRLRAGRVVELLTNPAYQIDARADFAEQANVKPLYDALVLLKVSPELKFDEQHSAWQVSYRDATQAERVIGVELAAQPEYKKLRVLAKEIALQIIRRSRRSTTGRGK